MDNSSNKENQTSTTRQITPLSANVKASFDPLNNFRKNKFRKKEMERRKLKKIPIDEAIQILHKGGMKVSKEEAEKIIDFLFLLMELMLHECFDNE